MVRTDGFRFWREVLGAPVRVVAPMVDASELAWRIFARRHGAQLCYTPMINAKAFVASRRSHRHDAVILAGEGPLIAQICGDDPETMLAAGRMLAELGAHAIDVNLGCPQNIARRGHYGSYLQDEWDLVSRIISTLADALPVPVTAKIRVFPDVAKTVRYAAMIRDAGAAILTVHGRTRDQRGQSTGLPDWSTIRAVRAAIRDVPVFGNGGVLFADDVERMQHATGVDAVMVAEGSLYNPYIFEDTCRPAWLAAREYMRVVRELSEAHGIATPAGMVRGHLFKIYRPAVGLLLSTDEQRALGDSLSEEALCAASEAINARLERAAADEFASGASTVDPTDEQTWPRNHSSAGLGHPLWISRAHIRGPVLPVPGSADFEACADSALCEADAANVGQELAAQKDDVATEAADDQPGTGVQETCNDVSCADSPPVAAIALTDDSEFHAAKRKRVDLNIEDEAVLICNDQ